MTLTTERLELQLLSGEQLGLWTEDLPALKGELDCAYCAEPMEDGFRTIVEGQGKKTLADPQNTVWHSFWFLIRRSDRIVVGSADFKNVPDEDGAVELGYGLGKNYEGRGYMTEAARAMCSWALSQPGVTSVVAETKRDNRPSQRILSRCGFRLEREEGTLWWRLTELEKEISG